MDLRKFILVRFLAIIPTLFLLATIVFVVMHVIPGDPVESIMGSTAITQEQIDIIRHTLGLDKPIYIQYLDYMGNLLKGDFGYSFVRSRPVIEEILYNFPATIELTIFSMLLAIPLGVLLGIAAAKRKGKKVDLIIRFGAITIWCFPIFWLGLMFQIFIVFYFPSIPIFGRIGSRIVLERITGFTIIDSIMTNNIEALFDSLKHLILPVFTLGISMAASLTRVSRTNLIAVLDEDFIKVVRLKGSSEKVVFNKHVLPNALIPILTYAGLQLAMLMGGAILTETTFSWPGLGRLLLFAVSYRDFNLIQGCVVFWAIIIISINLVVDIFYAIIDPRVRY